MKEQKQRCCICGKEFEGFGHNAEPVMLGVCCEDCNTSIVLPTRIVNMKVIPEPKVGDKVHIVFMKGEPEYNGREGKVTCVDDIGQLHGTWGGLALIPGTDVYFRKE